MPRSGAAVTAVASLVSIADPPRVQRRRARLTAAVAASVLVHATFLAWLALSPVRLPPPAALVAPALPPGVQVTLVPLPPNAAVPPPRPEPRPEESRREESRPEESRPEPAPERLVPAPPAPAAPAPTPSLAPAPSSAPQPSIAPLPPAPTPLARAPELQTRNDPAVSLRAAPALSQSDAESERRRREALEAARALAVPAPSTLPAVPSPAPAAPRSGSPTAPAAPSSVWRPPSAGGPRAGVAGPQAQAPGRWSAGPVGGGVQRALRRSVGCNHENFAGLTNAERAACEERETRLAEANAQDVGPVSTARYIQRGMEDRDCRRMRHSTDHASTFGNGSSERTRGGVTGVPGCGTVLRNLDRIGSVLRGRDPVD